MTKGVTLPELLITMAIATILFAIGGISFANIHSESQLDLFASEAQNFTRKAQARTLNNIQAGVYFEANRFVYFEGPAFVENDAFNEVVALPNGLSLTTINFPNHTLRFVPVSGTVENYSPPANVVITESRTGKSRTIAVNELGVVSIL